MSIWGTQIEVIEAFVHGEDEPYKASNMRRFESDLGGKEYLCGGLDGEEYLFAVREPIQQITIYGRFVFGSFLGNNGANRQRRKITQIIQHRMGNLYPDSYNEMVTVENQISPPEVAEIEYINP